MSKETILNGQPGLALGPGPEGWWDSEHVSSPQVLRESDGTWKMWYYGRDATFDSEINLPSGRCGMAISRDGIAWERVRGPLTMGAVLEPSPSTVDRFDNAHVGVSDVYKDNGLYWMWYFGGDQKTLDLNIPEGTYRLKGVHMRPGCAISRDGLHWTRLEGPYRGAFLDHGEQGEWDALFCSWPRVMKDDDGSYKMYYHTLNPANFAFSVGMAISEDGFRWKKVGQILGPGELGSFDQRGLSCRHVLKIEGQYVMFYEGFGPGGYCIGLALSEDGFKWYKEQPIFYPSPKGSGLWDGGSVGTPTVVMMPDGSYRMYYVGLGEGPDPELSAQHKEGGELVLRHQIGVAISDGPNFRKWHRWGE